MRYTTSSCDALDAVLHARQQAGLTTLLDELEKLEILDSAMLMSSSTASSMPFFDVVRSRLPPTTEVHVGEFVNCRSHGSHLCQSALLASQFQFLPDVSRARLLDDGNERPQNTSLEQIHCT
jgi:hypothetical protein